MIFEVEKLKLTFDELFEHLILQLKLSLQQQLQFLQLRICGDTLDVRQQALFLRQVQAQDGKVRLRIVGRLEALRPVLDEKGVPVLDAQGRWNFAQTDLPQASETLLVPAGTPEPVLSRLRAAARAAAQDERARTALTAAGTYFQYQDAPEFARFVQADERTMASVVERIGRVD